METSRPATGLLVLLLTLCMPLQADAPRNTQTPQQLFKDLFATVQDERLFQDGKLFADALPKESPAAILQAYHAEPLTAEALKSFVAAHFTLPEAVAPAPSPPARVGITEHIDKLWDQL